MARDVAKAILEGIRRKREDSEMQMYATEPSGVMGEDGKPKQGERGWFPADREGFKPPKGEMPGGWEDPKPETQEQYDRLIKRYEWQIARDAGKDYVSATLAYDFEQLKKEYAEKFGTVEGCNDEKVSDVCCRKPSGAMGEDGSPYSAYAADADVIGDGYSMLQIIPGRQWWVFDDSSQIPVVAIEAGHVSDQSGGWKPTSDLKVKGWRGGELDGTFASIDEAKAAALEALRSGELGGEPKQVGVSTDVGVDEPGVRGDTRDPAKPGNLDESEWMSLDEMELTCVECADKMRDRKMTAILRREAKECIDRFGAKKDRDEG